MTARPLIGLRSYPATSAKGSALSSGSPVYTLELRQRLTAVKNRYDLVRVGDGVQEETLGFVEQKRFSLKERVTVFTDESKTSVAFTIGARNVLELRGTYDVEDASGQRLATLTKEFKKSLLRSTYTIETPLGTLTVTERNMAVAILRRVQDNIPLPIFFDVKAPDGTPVATVDRKIMRLRDLYYIRVYDDRLEWRVAAAIGVACDAFMNR